MTDHDLQRAEEAGWMPKRITWIRQWPCQMGCGRAMILDMNDAEVGYICPHCRESAMEFLSKLKKPNRARKKARKKKGGEGA